MSGTSTRKKNTTKASKPKKDWSGLMRWLMLVVIGAVFVFNYHAVFDRKIDLNGDNINYFLLAKSLSEGNGYMDIIPPVPTPHVHFPPGYPMFMSVFMHIFPDNVIAMKILNGVLFFLAVLMLFRIVRKTTGGRLWLAFAVCLLTVMHSSLLRWSVVMMSEMLYIVISFGIILITMDLDTGRIFTKGKKDWRQILRLVLLCLLVISSYLVRTMGISVVLAAALAFGVAALRRLRLKEGAARWLGPALVAIAICLSLTVAHEGWTLRNRHVAPGSGSDYSSGFLYTADHVRMTPTLWLSRLKGNFTEYVSAWIPGALIKPVEVIDHMITPEPTVAGWLVGAALIFLMAYGIYKLKKGKVVLASYLLITFAVLMLYQEQYAGIRYFIPVLPMMFLAVLNGIWELVEAVFGKKNGRLIPSFVVVAAALLLFPFYLKGQKVYKQVASFDDYTTMNPKSSFGHYIMAAEWIKDNTPSSAVIACRKPEVMFMYSGYRHSVRIPMRGDEKEVMDALKSSGADLVVLDTWARQAYSVLYPAMRGHAASFPVVYSSLQDDEPAPTAVVLIRDKNP